MRILLFLLFTICFFGCKKKKDEYVFTGTITNASTGQPVQGESITLIQYSLTGNETKTIGTVITGTDGKYTINTKREKASKYVINADQNRYFSKSLEVNVNDLKVGDNINNISVYPIGYVKFRIKHINAVAGDEFKLFRQGSNTSCSTCCLPGQSIMAGNIDTVFYCPANAGSNFKFEWNINGIQDYGSENFIIPAFDTVYFEKIY